VRPDPDHERAALVPGDLAEEVEGLTRPHAAGIQDPLKDPSVVESPAPEPSREPTPPGSDPAPAAILLSGQGRREGPRERRRRLPWRQSPPSSNSGSSGAPQIWMWHKSSVLTVCSEDDMIAWSQRGHRSTSQFGGFGSGVMGVPRHDGRSRDPLGREDRLLCTVCGHRGSSCLAIEASSHSS